jgi:hypothetical protein
MKTLVDLVDTSTLVVDGLDTGDYPDFCDAYFSEGFYLDGTELPDDALETLTEDKELLHQIIIDHIF